MTTTDAAIAQAFREVCEESHGFTYRLVMARASELDATYQPNINSGEVDNATPPAQAAEGVERVARLERENVVLSYERERWSAAYDSAVKVLVGIHAVIYPMVVKLDDGREMRFNSPYLHEQMQAISDRIRAIPDELAAIAAMRGDPS